MSWKNEELYIVTLKWKATYKKLYLGGEKGEAAKNKIKLALKSIEKLGKAASSWEDFYSKSLEILKKQGFEQVDT